MDTSDHLILSTDHLLERTVVTDMMEMALLLSGGGPATVVTGAFKKNKILGPIVDNRIISSGLSKRAASVDEWNRLKGKSLAVRGLPISCHGKGHIGFSDGVSEFIPSCEIQNSLLFIHDSEIFKKDTGFLEKVKQRGKSTLRKKSLNTYDEIIVFHQKDKSALEKIVDVPISVMGPFINLQDFRPYPEESLKGFNFDFGDLPNRYWTCSKDFQGEDLKWALEHIKRWNRGPLIHLGEGESSDYILYTGERCEGIDAPVISGSQGHFTLLDNKIPYSVFQALACGTVVISREKEKSSRGRQFVDDIPAVAVLGRGEWLDELPPYAHPQLLHKQANCWHPAKFKGDLTRLLERVGIINS